MREKNSPDKDLKIADIVEEYEEALNRSETPSVEIILAEHSGIAKELKIQLAMVNLLREEFVKMPTERKKRMLADLERELAIDLEIKTPEYQKKRAEVCQRARAKAMVQIEAYEKELGPKKESLKVSEPVEEYVSPQETGLKVDTRQDIFLLMLYVPEKGEIAKPIWGRFKLAKNLFYAGMKAGVDYLIERYYDYQPDACGPFTKEIFEDISNLKHAGLITDTPPQETIPLEDEEIDAGFKPYKITSVFKLTPNGLEIAQRLFRWAKHHAPKMVKKTEEIKTRLAQMTPEQIVQEIENEYPTYTKFCKLLKKELNDNE